MKPRPVTSDEDGIARMKELTRRLREANCPRHLIPQHLLDEDALLREWARRRVLAETARLDQEAARTLEAIDNTGTSAGS